ncbi:MAG: hypothetical protein JSU82_05170 [Rhodospirillales bacterium]|nr:MAG: hypothetical protein JSU82_05170 [Rhodospirillales bacterium]
MEYLVVALDGTDAEAPGRRTAAREAHLAGIAALTEQGIFRAGGAILDDDGNMVGSAVIYECPDRNAVEQHVANDPYSKGDVWRDVTIYPFRMLR